MYEGKNISETDEKVLRRFYGDKWEDHADELMTKFAWYSDEYGQNRRERLHKLPAKERLYRCIFGFEGEPEWSPDFERAQEIIRFPMALAQFSEDKFEKLCKFVELLRGIINGNSAKPEGWRLSMESIPSESGEDRMVWVVRGKSKDGETFETAYETLERALADILIDCPGEEEEWLDYAALFMYDGVTGNDLRK